MSEETAKDRRIIGYSFTEIFLICGLATLTFFIGNDVGYDRGLRNVYHEIRQNLRPAAVITHEVRYFDYAQSMIKNGKRALILQEFGDIPFTLNRDNSLSHSKLEVFVSRTLTEEEKEALVSHLENLKD